MDITIHRPDDLSASIQDAWHRAMDESPEYANPFLAPEFAAGIGRYRGGTQVAVLRENGEPVGFFPYERNVVGAGRAIGLGLSDCQALVHCPGVTWDAQELLRACGLSILEFDHLVEEQKPFGRYVTGTFASPVVDLKPGDSGYAEWLRAAYPGQAKTTLKKERRLGRDVGDVRFVFDERDPRLLRTLMQWKSAQYRRTGRMDRFARPWIVDLVDHLFQVREEHFTGVLSVLYAGDRPVAAHFGPRSRTVLAAWFTAYDPEFHRYSPGLMMHLRIAEAAARHGVSMLDLGRGDKEYKDWLKTRELRVGEGFATRPHPVAAAHRLWRRPVRGLRNLVLAHPTLREPADRLLKTVGTLRTSGRADSERAGPHAR
ncbi:MULTISPECIES: GNAT family N-acetyltransferase [Streptomyces]|uniref:GNAT family N-acetyltransferase n=1 Tax=Streptomyces dengpaensis TaxID=2049881 RepID=A0ABM6T015_9ACTN|nr:MULTISPECIES: GNAT family N-acetyltransferase [Streptomyces]AVH60335.1 GNAT family N-acetyltransferase [Streptomyces dengpaensis]PIB06655.1 cellulose biosynthesis protein CelD [Streptomyces sp. HG99]